MLTSGLAPRQGVVDVDEATYQKSCIKDLAHCKQMAEKVHHNPPKTSSQVLVTNPKPPREDGGRVQLFAIGDGNLQSTCGGYNWPPGTFVCAPGYLD